MIISLGFKVEIMEENTVMEKQEVTLCGWTADPGMSCLSPPGSVRAKQLLWITVSHRTMMRVDERNAELQ